MSVNFDDMVDELKKEISDGLTKRISFVPFDPVKKDKFDSNKNKYNIKKKVYLGLIIIGILFLAFSVYLFLNNKKVKYSYKIKNNIETKVYLNDKNFEEKNQASDNYLSNLVQEIHIRFINNVNIKDNYNSNKNVYARMLVVDSNDENNIIFKSDEYLIKDKTNLSYANKDEITDIYINYQNYNKKMDMYKKNIKIPYKALLEVTYTNNIKNSYDLSDEIKQVVKIPLSTDIVSIEKEYEKEATKNVTELKNNIQSIIIMFIISLVDIVIFLILLIRIYLKNRTKISVLEKKYRRIMKNYNNIVEVENDNFDNKLLTIDVKYFVDLIDAQQELHIPILCYNDEKTSRVWFYIVTDKYIYKYELNKNDEVI